MGHLDQKMPSPFYLFIHIPKTAGTTLRSILDLQYGRKNVLTYYNQTTTQLLDNLEWMLKAGRHDYKALIGHFHFGVHTNLARPASYVTFLRSPIDLAVSAINERRKNFAPEFLEENGKPMPDEKYIRERVVLFSNVQTKILAGIRHDVVATEDDFQTARKNLDHHFKFVGLSEDFETSFLLLAKHLGWTPCIYHHLNKGPQHQKLPSDIIELLREVNKFDIRLHADAGERIAEEVEKGGKIFSQARDELVHQLNDQQWSPEFNSVSSAHRQEMLKMQMFIES